MRLKHTHSNSMTVTMILLRNCVIEIREAYITEQKYDYLIFLCLANFIIISYTVILSNYGIKFWYRKRTQKSTDTDTSTDTTKNTRYYRYSIPSAGTRPITSSMSTACKHAIHEHYANLAIPLGGYGERTWLVYIIWQCRRAHSIAM